VSNFEIHWDPLDQWFFMRHGDDLGVLFWIVVYVAVAILLHYAVVRTFNRCVGRLGRQAANDPPQALHSNKQSAFHHTDGP
jgi:hypothetical protein